MAKKKRKRNSNQRRNVVASGRSPKTSRGCILKRTISEEFGQAAKNRIEGGAGLGEAASPGGKSVQPNILLSKVSENV